MHCLIPAALFPEWLLFVGCKEVSTAGPFRAGVPRVLFEGLYVGSTLRSYDVTHDGEFILVRRESEPPDQRVTKLTVMLGWGEELKRRVPRANTIH